MGQEWGKSGARAALVVHVLVFAGRNAISLPMYGQLKSRCHVKVDASMDVRKGKGQNPRLDPQAQAQEIGKATRIACEEGVARRR